MDDTEELAEIIHFYNTGIEKERLQRGLGKIEFERTQKIIERYLPKDKQVIYDIGGGTGTYSVCWQKWAMKYICLNWHPEL